MPKWIPAENQGQKVASYFNIPISFKLTPSEPKDSTATTKPKNHTFILQWRRLG